MRAPPHKVCIINFTGERANWGCRATSWELVRALNDAFPPDNSFELNTVGLLSHHALDLHLCEEKGREIRDALSSEEPSKTQRASLLELARARYGPLLEKVRDSDFVIFQGEGTMTGTDFIRADRLLLLPWVARHVFDKPTVWLNQTLFSADDAFTPILFTCLQHASRVLVREPASFDWLIQNGADNVEMVPDTAFLTDPLEHGSLAESLAGRGYFCVSGSAALFEEQVPVFLDSVRRVSDETGLLPVFAASVGRDCLLARKARKMWPKNSFEEVPHSMPYPAVAHFLGGARFLVGGRYHMSMLAAISGTPSVLLETNTFKHHGLRQLLNVDWRIHPIVSETESWTVDALCLAEEDQLNRHQLRERVKCIRENIHTGFRCWWDTDKLSQAKCRLPRPPAVLMHAESGSFRSLNDKISSTFCYPTDDTPEAKWGNPPDILSQLLPLTVYLRRGIRPVASFRCVKQLIEGNLDLALSQLDTRWLISVCDSYTDHGDAIESRNALLISSFLNWERLAESYLRWSNPDLCSLKIDRPIPQTNEPLWDGLITVHLRRGDTLNNLLIRYARVLHPTPVLLAIWRELLSRIRANNTLLAALETAHVHLFDENLEYLADPGLDIPRWRRWTLS
jgi:polysaccharide pyruvyl transferase WcaK-like protein